MIKSITHGVYPDVKAIFERVKADHPDIMNRIVASFIEPGKIYPSYEKHVDFYYFFNEKGENIAYHVDGDLVILQKGRPFHVYPLMEEYVL